MATQQVSSVRHELLIERARYMVTAPWSVSQEEKIEMAYELARTERSEAIWILTALLDQVELPFTTHAPRDSEVKYGGPVVIAAAESLALMKLPGAFEVLVNAYQNTELYPEIRAGIVWAMRAIDFAQADIILSSALANEEAAIRAAAVEALEYKVRKQPEYLDQIEFSGATGVAVDLYLIYRRVPLRRAALRFLKVAKRAQVFQSATAILSGVTHKAVLHRGIELALALPCIESERFLLEMMYRLDLPLDVYPFIASVLGESEDTQVRYALYEMAGATSLWEKVPLFLNGEKRKAFEARRLAARSLEIFEQATR